MSDGLVSIAYQGWLQFQGDVVIANDQWIFLTDALVLVDSCWRGLSRELKRCSRRNTDRWSLVLERCAQMSFNQSRHQKRGHTNSEALSSSKSLVISAMIIVTQHGQVRQTTRLVTFQRWTYCTQSRVFNRKERFVPSHTFTDLFHSTFQTICGAGLPSNALGSASPA